MGSSAASSAASVRPASVSHSTETADRTANPPAPVPAVQNPAEAPVKKETPMNAATLISKNETSNVKNETSNLFSETSITKNETSHPLNETSHPLSETPTAPSPSPSVDRFSPAAVYPSADLVAVLESSRPRRLARVQTELSLLRSQCDAETQRGALSLLSRVLQNIVAPLAASRLASRPRFARAPNPQPRQRLLPDALRSARIGPRDPRPARLSPPRHRQGRSPRPRRRPPRPPAPPAGPRRPRRRVPRGADGPADR